MNILHHAWNKTDLGSIPSRRFDSSVADPLLTLPNACEAEQGNIVVPHFQYTDIIMSGVI